MMLNTLKQPVALLTLSLTLLAGCGQSSDTASSAETHGALAVAHHLSAGIDETMDRDRVLSEIAVEYVHQGDSHRAAAVAREIEGAVDRSWAEAAIAAHFASNGEQEQAEHGFVRALGIIDNEPDADDQAWMLADLAGRYQEAGQNGMALQVLERALAQADTLDEPQRQAWLLAEIGGRLGALGERDQAAEVLSRSYETGGNVGSPPEVVQLLLWQADRQHKAGNDVRALELLMQADSLVERVKDDLGATQISLDLAEMARLYGVLGQQEQAVEVLERALELVPSIQDVFLETRSRLVIAGIYSGLPEQEQARKLLASLDEAVSSRSDATERRVLTTKLAIAHAEAGQFTRALTQAGAIDGAYDQSWAVTRIAAAYTAAGKTPEPQQQVLLQTMNGHL
ncbi:MAG: hypothetical protein EA349_12615 [Halomonadaceae bacterium]|nr:MAG: hypothetical protein EA349_12615 [Halomonadaceae bacterium]